jgi:hypothetical protein
MIAYPILLVQPMMLDTAQMLITITGMNGIVTIHDTVITIVQYTTTDMVHDIIITIRVLTSITVVVDITILLVAYIMMDIISVVVYTTVLDTEP